MPREIITVQCGQCGNQVGGEFWSKLCQEHGIRPGGGQLPESAQDDRKDVFFYEADDARYVPRAVLLDLEPRVVSGLQSRLGFFNRENMFISKEQSGAGNVWASGYKQGQTHIEEILEMLDREAEGSDSLSGFFLTHSIAGGSGSGLGSLLLEKMQERYPKKLLQTFSVFPNQKAPDVVVQAYNSVLTINHLLQFADSTVVLDNTSLDTLIGKQTGFMGNQDTKSMSFDVQNQLIATVMSASTQPLRFPGFMANDLASLVGCLVPVPALHFLISGYTPIYEVINQKERQQHQMANYAQKGKEKEVQTENKDKDEADIEEQLLRNAQASQAKTSVLDIMQRLLNPQNCLVNCSRSGSYISLMNILSGDVNVREVQKAVNRLVEKRQIKFSTWTSQNIQVLVTRSSSLVKYTSHVQGLQLANHTSISEVFDGILKQFKASFKSGTDAAFIEPFRRADLWNEDNIQETFEYAKNSVEFLSKEYKEAERSNYLMESK